MQCAGADLEPCRCRVHASDQYILLAVPIGFTRDLPCPGALEVTEEGLVNLETLVMLDMAITTITTTNTVTTLKMDTIIAIKFN